MKEKALRDMTPAELCDRLERVRERNPHGFEQLQTYRNTAARLRRWLAERTQEDGWNADETVHRAAELLEAEA